MLAMRHWIYGVAGAPALSTQAGAGGDHCQEVFLAVWRHAATFDPTRGAFRAWVLQITRSSVLNELRPPRSETARHTDTAGQWAPVAIISPTRDSDPAEGLPGTNIAAPVVRARSRGPGRAPQQRGGFSLAFLEDLTHKQVAAFLQFAGCWHDQEPDPVRSRDLAWKPGPVGRGRLAPGRTPHLRRPPRARPPGRPYTPGPRLGPGHQQRGRAATPEPRPIRGINPEAHGNYRGRTGVDLGVLTLSYLAPAPRGYEYRAWASHGGRWTLLGRAKLDKDGRSLIIAEGPELAAPPDQLQVTLEPVGNGVDKGAVPVAPPVVRWPAQ